MADHLEGGQHIFEHFGHVLTQLTQLTAALRTGAGGRVSDFLARQMIRYASAVRLAAMSPACARTWREKKARNIPRRSERDGHAARVIYLPDHGDLAK